MSEMENIIKDMVGRLLGSAVNPDMLAAAETGQWADGLWGDLVENGLPSMLTSDDVGWQEAFPVVLASGRHCLPLPLPEAIAAGWLLSSAGLDMPDGLVGIAGFHKDDNLVLNSEGLVTGKVYRVAWGRKLTHMVICKDDKVVLVDLADCDRLPGTNLAGEPRDTLTLQGAQAEVSDNSTGLGNEAPLFLGALLRSGQMAGAIETVLEQSLLYAGERQQFGRSIGRFQVVQHMLAVLAEESAAATISAEYAFRALNNKADANFAMAVAKIRNGEAATIAASTGHQIHGAMGFAREHPLHNATRRLLAWRAEYGAEAKWAERIASSVIPLGGAGLWPFVTAAQKED